nr:MAG TPA: hypothetical protein [Bacteriophage sp.]
MQCNKSDDHTNTRVTIVILEAFYPLVLWILYTLHSSAYIFFP